MLAGTNANAQAAVDAHLEATGGKARRGGGLGVERERQPRPKLMQTHFCARLHREHIVSGTTSFFCQIGEQRARVRRDGHLYARWHSCKLPEKRLMPEERGRSECDGKQRGFLWQRFPSQLSADCSTAPRTCDVLFVQGSAPGPQHACLKRTPRT